MNEHAREKERVYYLKAKNGVGDHWTLSQLLEKLPSNKNQTGFVIFG